jgi:DNA-binding response OmpR family regulator
MPMKGRKMSVLVIEDDEYSRDALARLLLAEGYEAQAADDGESGFAKAQELRPDIIVLDLSLPGLDGKQLIRHIRDDNLLKAIPILVVTGHGDSEARSAVDLGADAYLTKPVDFDDLVHLVSDLCARTLAS